MEAQHPGQVDHGGAFTHLTVSVERGLPRRGRHLRVQRGRGGGQGEPDRVGQAPPGQPGQELLGPAPTVGADHHLAPGPGRVDPWQRGQRFLGDDDVVGRGVRAGVPGPEPNCERFTGPVATVIDEGAQRVKPNPRLKRRRLLLVTVRGHQGGVEVHDQRILSTDSVIRCVLTGQRPRPSPGHLPGGRDRGQDPVGVAGQRGDGA